jgi:serine/threonine protein kinase
MPKPICLKIATTTSVEQEHVKVADLGIASAQESFGAKLTRAGSVLGTPAYLAPESFRVERTMDERAQCQQRDQRSQFDVVDSEDL